MTRALRTTAAALALAIAAAPPAAAQHPLVALPLSDPAYTQLDGLLARGCDAARVSPFRPFMVKDVRRALREARGERTCAGPMLDRLAQRFLADSAAGDSLAALTRVTLGASLTVQGTALHGGEFAPLWRDVRATSAGTPPAVGLASLRLTWTGGPNLVAVSEAYGETSRRNDPTVRAGIFRNSQAVIDVNDAYVAGKLGPVVLSVGRAREAWLGEGDESLVLSAHGPPLDRVALTAQWSRFELRALLASLNDVVLTPAQDTIADSLGAQRWHRMLAAHALTYRPSRRVELTIGETALIPHQGSGFQLAYANPVLIYQMAQQDSARETRPEGNVNLTAFGGARATIGRATVQGELLIDDIQIDAKDRRRFPDQLAWNLRATYPLPLPLSPILEGQYRRIGSFTYLESFYTDSWQQYNQPIGSELGPDADLARLGAQLWPSGRLRLGVGVSRWRHGAHRIDQRPTPN
ncbi:MAG: hypothetical protein IRY91_04390, partial [Gemmatimonadaceae bacterium]|nr:hypothetical protein [Gemmatimonadaceae bacterium]